MVALVDEVFKALADPIRRLLLDRLRKQDGQTLGELCDGIELSRFGVMKHLKVLEGAQLVVTRKVGREKHHYLNRVPIRRIHDRWVSRYTAPIAAALLDLQQHLEHPMADDTTHIYQVFIRTTPERLWQALTDPEWTKRYLFSTTVASSFERGAPVSYTLPGGQNAVSGEVLEVVPLKRLVTTWSFGWSPELAAERTTVTWEIEPRGPLCKLTLTHDLAGAPLTAQQVADAMPGLHNPTPDNGWMIILSGLKTVIETGADLWPPIAM